MSPYMWQMVLGGVGEDEVVKAELAAKFVAARLLNKVLGCVCVCVCVCVSVCVCSRALACCKLHI